MNLAEIVAVVLGGLVIAAALCWCAITIALRLARLRSPARGGLRDIGKRGDVP